MALLLEEQTFADRAIAAHAGRLGTLPGTRQRANYGGLHAWAYPVNCTIEAPAPTLF